MAKRSLQKESPFDTVIAQVVDLDLLHPLANVQDGAGSEFLSTHGRELRRYPMQGGWGRLSPHIRFAY
eukprot:679170-Prymnesium_polylepis.2